MLKKPNIIIFNPVKRLYEDDELYDLNKDPEELVNIINDSNYKQILINMKEKII